MLAIAAVVATAAVAAVQAQLARMRYDSSQCKTGFSSQRQGQYAPRLEMATASNMSPGGPDTATPAIWEHKQPACLLMKTQGSGS